MIKLFQIFALIVFIALNILLYHILVVNHLLDKQYKKGYVDGLGKVRNNKSAEFLKVLEELFEDV